jgi:hypothetical protein
MPLDLPSASRRARRLLSAAVLAACSLSAQATLITFSELPWNPSTDPFPPLDDQPIGDAYAALGVRIDGGYLRGGDDGPAGQFMLGGNGVSIHFTGVLPNFVSLDFSSAAGFGGAWVNAQGPGGYAKRVDTEGDLSGPSPGSFLGTHASFSSPGGISGLSFENYYNFRLTAAVDNLYFGPVAPVPEPASLALMAAGVAGLLAGRRRRPAPG